MNIQDTANLLFNQIKKDYIQTLSNATKLNLYAEAFSTILITQSIEEIEDLITIKICEKIGERNVKHN